MRYVGVGRAVVAIPEDWPVVNAPCSAPEQNHVYPFVQGYVGARCTPLGEKAAAVTVGVGPLDGLSAGETDVICQGNETGHACELTFSVPSERASFHVLVQDDAEPSPDELRATLTMLPEGWTTVPALVYGTSADDADAALEDAGLESVRPDVNGPWYVTGTEPPMGSVVRVGSEVELLPGDG